MADDLLSDTQQGFSGGYNSAGLRSTVALNQFAAITNMRVLPSGECAPRPGLYAVATVASGAPAALSQHTIFNWTPGTSGAGDILVTGNDGVVTHGTFTSATQTLSLNSLSITSALHYSAAHFRDGSAECLYLAAGAGKLSKWTGTVFSDRTIGLTLNLKKVWVYNQRLFGITTTDQILYWSALNNGDTIGDPANGGGFATIRTYGGQTILGGFALGATNFILHQRAISVFRGISFDDVNIAAGTAGFSGEVGTLTQDSYCVVEGKGYVVTHTGLVLVTESGLVPYENPTRTDPIREYLNSSNYTAGPITLGYNERMQELWCLLPAPATVRGVGYILSLVTGVFSGHVAPSGSLGGRVMMLCNARDTNGVAQLLMSWQDLNSANQVHCYGVDILGFAIYKDGQNLGNFTYTSSVQCRRFYTDQPRVGKGWLRAIVQMGAFSQAATDPTTLSANTETDSLITWTAADGTTGTSAGHTDPTDPIALLSSRTSIIPLSGGGEYFDVTFLALTRSGSLLALDVEASDQGFRGH